MKSTAVAISVVINASGYHDIVAVHGPLVPHATMAPWKERSTGYGLQQLLGIGKPVVSRPKEYYQMRTPEICKFPLEIVVVQDATASFEDDFLQMKNIQLPAMLNELVASFPGSKVGVVSHRDKPILPYGNQVDYCQRFEAPLTSDLPSLQTLYGKMTSTGGADPPENAFGALHATAQSPTPGWSNQLATKIIVVSTDAQPHFSNDSDNIYGLPPYSGTFDEQHAAGQCLTQYYPSPEQVRSAVDAREAYVVTLVFDGAYQGNLVLRAWQWFNTYLGQTNEFINTMANDSSDFWAKLKVSLDAITSIECGTATTTTTMIPTTTTTTTTTARLVTATETTPATTMSIPECDCPPCITDPCAPCGCAEGVLIKLKYRPQKLSLLVENDVPENGVPN